MSKTSFFFMRFLGISELMASAAFLFIVGSLPDLVGLACASVSLGICESAKMVLF